MSDAVGRLRIENVFAAAMEGLALVADGEHVRVNDAYAAAFGADSPDGVVGRDYRDVLGPAVAEGVAAVAGGANGAGDDGERSYAEVECRRVDGTTFVADVSVRAADEGVLVAVWPVDDPDVRGSELRQSEQRYRTLVEAAPIPIGIVDADMELVYCNRAGARFIGVDDPSAAVGLSAEDVVAEADRGTAVESVRKSIAEGVVTDPAEQRFRTVDGETRIAVGTTAPITYEGRPAAQIVLNDVTEQRRSLERYESLVEAAPVPIGIVTRDGRIVYCNGAAAEFHGVDDPEDLVGTPGVELVHEDEQSAALNRLERVFEGETVTDTVERRYRRLDREDEYRVAITSIAPVTYEGDPAAQVVFRDVTERRRQRQRLERSERRYRTLAENIPGGSAALFEPTDDGDLRYTLVAGTVFENIEMDADDMEGERFSTFHTDGFREAHLEKYWAALDGERHAFEFTHEGRTFQAYTIPIDDDVGMTMTSDVTEERERQQELRRKERRYRTLAERIPNAVVSLFEADGDDLRYTLVAGTAFEEFSIDADDLEGNRLSAVHTDGFVERIVPKYRRALDGEASTYQHTFEGRIFEGHALPVEDDDGEVISGMAMARDVTESHERERELERQRDELETVNRINRLLLNITRALSEAPTREEVEATVCERLAGSELYRFAWIGSKEAGGEGIRPHVSAGREDGYLEEVTVPADEHPDCRGPGARAIETREVQVVDDVREDETFAPWREAAERRGYRSIVAVPLVHGDAVYGLLGVYSGRPEAFSEREQSAFEILGETVGFVINAVQNRRLLVADAVTELTFEVGSGAALPAAASAHLDAVVSLAGYTATDADAWLVYLDVEGAAPGALVEFLRDSEGVEEAWVIADAGNEGTVGIRQTTPSFVGTALDAGATIQEATAVDGVLRTTLQVPGSADLRNVVDALAGAYPGIEVVAQYERDRPVRTAAEFRERLAERLTERQLAALRAAYYGGYFEWPREQTAEDVADSMGIASATLHNHLRKAQRRLLELFFDDGVDRDATE